MAGPTPADSNPDTGAIGTAYRDQKPNAVFAKTRAPNGVDADRAFHLGVLC